MNELLTPDMLATLPNIEPYDIESYDWELQRRPEMRLTAGLELTRFRRRLRTWGGEFRLVS